MISEDTWLRDIFNHPVFKVDIAQYDCTPAEIAALVEVHAVQQSQAMYYAKASTTAIEMVRQLSCVGMYVVDVNTVFRLEHPYPPMAPISHGIEVTEIRPDHQGEVLRIASSCFRYSRFHIDPLIPEAIANRVKHEWIASYIHGRRGEALLVATLDSQPAGFLAVLASGDDDHLVRTIDLIGVDSAYQGQGVGTALVEHFIRYYEGGTAYLQVGTQSANIPSMRLYEKMGFRIASTVYVMHKHTSK